MYITRDAWTEHLIKDHRGTQVWDCIICDLPDHYHDSTSLVSHLQEQHPGAVNDRDSFAEACKTTAPPLIVSFLFCTWVEDQAENVSLEMILDHVAEHVHAFSLRSLPWATNADL